MKTFQIRISKSGMHRCLKFKSELPMESVLAAVKAVVKNTYHVSIKEIHLHDVQNVDGLADAIVNTLPMKLKQRMNRNR